MRMLNHPQLWSFLLQKCSSWKRLGILTSVYSCQTKQRPGSSLGPVCCSDFGRNPRWIERALRGITNWPDSGWVVHSCTAQLEEVWLRPLLQIQMEQRVGMGGLWTRLVTSVPSCPSLSSTWQLCSPKIRFWGGGTTWKDAIFAAVHQDGALITCHQSYIFCLQYLDI